MLRLALLCTLLVSCAQLKKIELEPAKVSQKILKPHWIKDLDPVHSAGNLPIGFASPLIKDDMIFMGDLSGKMNAYDLSTGRQIWQTDEKESINGQASSYKEWVVYGTQYGRLFARHFYTGKLIYSADLGAPLESAPVFFQGRMFVHLRNHQMMAIDAENGKILWSYKRAVPFTTTLQKVSRPLIYKNRLIVGFADGYVASLSMEEGVVSWEQKLSQGRKFVDVDVEPILFKGKVVAGSAAGPLYFLNPDSGFIERTIDYTVSHTPLVMGDTLLVGSVNGDVARIDSNGKIILKAKLDKDGVSSLVHWKDHFVVTTMGKYIYAIKPSNFEVVEKMNLGSFASAVFGDIQIENDIMAFLSSRNRLYLFK